MVGAAAVARERGPIGCRVMQAGKDYFTDKTPFTTLDQLAQARVVAAQTKRKYMVYYSERLHSESGMHASDLVAGGAIGSQVAKGDDQMIGTIVGELPSGGGQGLGARLLAGSYYGQTIQIWSALFMAAIVAAAFVGLIGIIERRVLSRMGART